MAISPDVVSFVRRRFNCCDLLQRSVIRNVARKASSVTLTTGMVATPSRRGWSVLIGIPSDELDKIEPETVRSEGQMERAQDNIHKQAAGFIATIDRREIKDDFSVLLQGNRLAQTASPG